MIDDLKSVRGEYMRLIELELTKFLLSAAPRQAITDERKKKIRSTAIELYYILNADFEENYNPHHGSER
jgi:hypothetical protein